MTTIPRLGVNWYTLWKGRLPPNETFSTLIQNAAAHGIQVIMLRWSASDHPSYLPHGETRPGEFWYDGKVERNSYGDITTPLHSAADTPQTTNMRHIFDLCAEHAIEIIFQIGGHAELTTPLWDFHPYRLNRLNARRNVSRAGEPGWLRDPNQFFTNSQAREAFKNRVTAFVNNFGNHPALWCIDLGNELTFDYDKPGFLSWVEEMSDHLWNILPGPNEDKPYVTLSQLRLPIDRDTNETCRHLAIPGNKLLVDWHSYPSQWHGGATLQQIHDAIRGWQELYPDALLLVGESWPWGAGPTAVPDKLQDINIPPEAYALPDGTFEPMSLTPYPHERMFVFLAMAMGIGPYLRWWGYMDGAKGYSTIKRCSEILYPAREMADLLPAAGPTSREHDVEGDVAFQAATLLDDNTLAFVLVGQGTQTVNFGVTGDWTLTTYDWSADEPTRIVDQQPVQANDATIDFDQYPEGFCAGILSANEQLEPPKPPPPEPPEPPPPEPPPPEPPPPEPPPSTSFLARIEFVDPALPLPWLPLVRIYPVEEQ